MTKEEFSLVCGAVALSLNEIEEERIWLFEEEEEKYCHKYQNIQDVEKAYSRWHQDKLFDALHL